MGVILRCKLAMHKEYVLKLPCQFVQNFLSYVSAKYYMNWFTAGKIITKIIRANFLLRLGVHIVRLALVVQSDIDTMKYVSLKSCKLNLKSSKYTKNHAWPITQ